MSRDTRISLIDPDPEQPRKVFDEARLAELAASMAANGLAVPILLRPAHNGRFLIVHGERRWRAAQRLGWETIPADVRKMSAEEAHWLSLVENVQRANLSPIEEAEAYQARLAAGLTQEALAKRIGKDRSYIAQKLRLLTLPAPLQYYLNHRAFSEGHARRLLRIRGMYHDKHPVKTSLTESPTVTAENVIGTFIGTRPADFPQAYIPLVQALTKRPKAVIVEASQVFLDRWVAQRQIPAWEMTAFWYATVAVAYELSVVDLDALISRWWDLIQSGIAFMRLHGNEHDPPDRAHQTRHWYDWWGYRADLRHAGLLDACLHQGLTDEQWNEASIYVCREGMVYPSECQAWGPYHDAYMAEVQREEAQREADARC